MFYSGSYIYNKAETCLHACDLNFHAVYNALSGIIMATVDNDVKEISHLKKVYYFTQIIIAYN